MKFLIAVDDTDASWDAARFAAELAGDDDELIVVNVVGSVEPVAQIGSDLAVGAAGLVEVPTIDSRRAAIARLRPLLDEIEPHDVHVTAGSVVGRILAVAEVEQPDMIVTGTRDQHAILRFLGGSVSQALVNDAPCPVLVVR